MINIHVYVNVHSQSPDLDLSPALGIRKVYVYRVLLLPEQCSVYFLSCSELCSLFALHRSLTRNGSSLPGLRNSSSISNWKTINFLRSHLAVSYLDLH